MLKKYFYKWVKFHIKQINNRQKWINATIFRYKHLLRKSFKAIKQQKKIDYESILKRKVFNAFILSIEENEQMIKEIKNIQLRRYFQKFKNITQEQQRTREVTDAIVDCYNNKLLMKWFVKLKKAIKILKKRKSIEKQIINKKKQLFFDKWNLKLQDVKLYDQLLQDSQIYYNEVLIKKTFKGWKQLIKNKKIYEKQLLILSNYFKNWRLYSKEQNIKRNQKFQPIHIKWRKLVFFAYWKTATLDSQKEKLAKDFYLYKLFQSWKKYINEIQQILLRLQDKELALTLQQMKRIKKRYLNNWINRYNYTIDKAGLNKVLLQTKLKQIRVNQLQTAFNSFKNNLKLNQFQRKKQVMILSKIFNSLRYFSDIRKIKLNRLQQFQHTRKLKNQKIIYNILKQQYSVLQEKLNKAKFYYNKRLTKDFFHLFIQGIIKQYQKQLKLSALFYYKRRLIYIFSALQQHCQQQIKRRLNKKKLENFLGQKQYKLIKLVFKKMRGILVSELKGKKKVRIQCILLMEIDKQIVSYKEEMKGSMKSLINYIENKNYKQKQQSIRMIRSLKQYTQEASKRLLSPLESQHFGYSPEPNLIQKPQTHVPRKSSLIDLRHFEDRRFQLPKQKENQISKKPVTSDPMSSKKILQIVKEAQQQLYSSQQPRTQQQAQQPKQIRAITLESQNEGLNFTFAQNFSNKKLIMKEFSAHSLKKKFFA